MSRKQIINRPLTLTLAIVKKHGVLVVILAFLAIVASSSRMLRGSLTEGEVFVPLSGSSSSAPMLPSLRTCSATGTVFETIWNFSQLEKIFKRDMAAVTNERIRLMTGPSRWSCLKDEQPNMPELKNMASRLPGWYFQEQKPAPGGMFIKTVHRPVTWNSFSSVVAEYERVYECRLGEIASRALLVVASNLDYDQPAEFCCTEPSSPTGGCVIKTSDTSCVTAPSASPNCNNECGVHIDSFQISSRLEPLIERMSNERLHARLALERTLNTLRSFETNYAIAKQLNCYERASVDLQNELSLLSDAASCMPRLWDVVTSLHDRKTP